MKRFVLISRNPLFWVLVFCLLAGIFLHYPQQMPFADIEVSSLFGLERHPVERLLFLATMIIGGFLFGLKGGIVCIVLASAVMLPRVFLISSFPTDALFEVLLITTTGALVTWQIGARRRQIGQRDQAIIKLEAIRRELDSYVQTIKEDEKRLSILHSVTTVINQSVTLYEIFSTVAGKIIEATDVEIILIYLRNEKTDELDIQVHPGVSEEFVHEMDHVKAGEGFNGWVAQTGEHCWIEDSQQDPRLSREVVIKEGIRSQFIVPLKSREKVVGTLCIAAHYIRRFTKEERELFMLIGTELGVAVEKARLYEESERVGRRFRELFEKAHDAIWVHDFDGNFLATNQHCSKLVGYNIDELNNENVSRFLTPEGRKLAMEIRQKLLAGEEIPEPYEQRLIKKDGSEVTIMLTTSLLNYEGTSAFQNIARDVTKERQLQENLHLYVRQITRAHEEERKRIARDLHDDSIQAVIVLSRQIDDLIDDVASIKTKPTVMARHLETIRKELDKILERMRFFIQDLRPATLDYLGLLPALRELISQLEQQAKIQTELHVVGTEQHFSPEDELLIYRIVQEALRNIWKHAGAKKVEVAIEFDNDKTMMTISDDGKGFEIGKGLEIKEGEFVQAGKIGLAGMQERANLLNSILTIHSDIGHGTKVVLEIPSGRWGR